MVPTGPARQRASRLALAGFTALTVVLGLQTPGNTGSPAQPSHAPGLGQVAIPRHAQPGPLPARPGTVRITQPDLRSASGDIGIQLNDQVALRALVVATTTTDFGIPTLTTTLDRVGAAYDILYTATDTLSASTLVRPDGVGRYNAILLTNSMALYESGGSYLSGLTPTEWNTLWAYERAFGVRQAALYTSYGSWPEDYCLTSNGEGGVGDAPLPVSLTTPGSVIFDYLNPGAQIPVSNSYVYRTSIKTGCAATSLMNNGPDVLAVSTTSTDGRERLALTFTSNQYLLHSDLLVYGLIRWATRGLHFGELKHHLNVDVDDWFNNSDHYHEDGTVEYSPGFRVSGHDTYNLHLKQNALRAEHPLAAGFTFNIPFNGSDIDPFAGSQCYPDGDDTTLTSTTKCLKDSFRWINHTFNHPELNHTNYNVSHGEINDNRAAGNAIALNAPDSVLKTPEYSGLGVYNPDPDNDTGPPTDFGLEGSNQALLNAAADLGVTVMAGNMSFGSHVPANFNAARVHPLKPSIQVVPCWPTNIAYHTTTPNEETVFYNSFYGPNGLFPYWPTNRTYAQIVDWEAGIGLRHVTSGSIYAHTFHIANVRDFGSGDTLLTDWVDAVMTKYDAYYSVPLLNSAWTAIGAYTAERTAHFAARTAGAAAVYDRVAGTITVTSPAAGTVRLGGVTSATPGATAYGSDITVPVTLAAGTPVTLNAAPRP